MIVPNFIDIPRVGLPASETVQAYNQNIYDTLLDECAHMVMAMAVNPDVPADDVEFYEESFMRVRLILAALAVAVGGSGANELASTRMGDFLGRSAGLEMALMTAFDTMPGIARCQNHERCDRIAVDFQTERNLCAAHACVKVSA